MKWRRGEGGGRWGRGGLEGVETGEGKKQVKVAPWDLRPSLIQSPSLDYSDKSSVVFSLRLQRLRTYYVVAIVIPVLFLSLTATLVFALPADSGEKMGTSITVLLSFAVYLTIVSDQMPQTSSSVRKSALRCLP